METELDQFQIKLNYAFKNKALLLSALTHKSYCIDANSEKPDNERLEFLGDAILNFVVAEKLLINFPLEAEGTLSKKRASLVNKNKLFEISKKFELENNMLFGPGELKQGNHLNERIHASCLEALIGAIYLDSDFINVRNWIIDNYSTTDFENISDVSFENDFKSRLQEFTQKNKLGTPRYDLLLTTGPSHKPMFLISLKLNDEEKCRAEGTSKKAAEQKAAELYFSELMKIKDLI